MLLNKNPNDIKEMFDCISSRYDFMNNVISFYTHFWVKKVAIKNLKIKPCSFILDLCCGSGDLAGIAKKQSKTSNIIGMDFSFSMLEIAKKKYKNIKFIEGDAYNIPFDKNCFDYILMGFGLRNIKNVNQALSEVNRVLKTGGKFLHLDFNSSSKFIFLYDKIILFILKLVTKNVEPYFYLLKSKNEFLNNDELVKLFSEYNFKHIKTKKMLFNMIAFQIMEKI